MTPADLLTYPDPETATLGALLIDPAQVKPIRQILPRAAAFFDARNRLVYHAMLSLTDAGKRIDYLTLTTQLDTLGVLAEVGGAAYIVQLLNAVPSALGAADYARAVQENAAKRYIEQIAGKLVRASQNGNGPMAAIGDAITDLRNLQERLADQPDRFALHWAAEAFEEQPPTDWIIDGLFAAGSVAILAGDGGTGKTWALLDAAVCVSLGKPWLAFPTSPGPVLIVDEESGGSRLKRRLGDVLRGHGADDHTAVGFVSMAGFNLYDPAHAMTLRDLVKANCMRLVIVDALVDIMPGGDENKANDIQPIFHTMRAIAEECQCAFVVIHHTNRNGGYRGSSALKGACDILILVEKDESTQTLTFKSEKNRDGEPVKFSAFGRWGYNQFDMAPTTPPEAAVTFTKGESYVLRYLSQHGAALLSDIENHADSCSSGTAKNAIYALVSKGLAARVDDGNSGKAATYDLTAAGRQAA